MVRRTATILMLGLLSMAPAVATAAPRTFTGTISDTMCGKAHMIPGKSNAECIRECLKVKGTSYALVVGDKVYTLDGDSKQIEALSAKRVKVTGELNGTKLNIKSITAVR
jgi:hypothetical protein